MIESYKMSCFETLMNLKNKAHDSKELPVDLASF